MPNNKTFQTVPGRRPGRSVFDLSYDKKLTCDMGELIPVLCEMAVPGDTWMIGNSIVLRFQPMLAPIMHEVSVYVHYFFVPIRILESEFLDWYSEDWENFITGGIDGDWSEKELPRIDLGPGSDAYKSGTLWDYFGFPTGIYPKGTIPVYFPWMAYIKVYNDYYRDINFMPEVTIGVPPAPGMQRWINPQRRCWEKDYFTSAQLEQQRGTPPALPIQGITHALWADDKFVNDATEYGHITFIGNAVPRHWANLQGSTVVANAKGFFNENTVDLSTASTFDISDLRLAFQVQRWMELNQRCGPRYVEQLKARYGVSPRDDRLQRPEYIGGTKSPIIISEVLQTSEEGATPQGNLAGHGISANRQFAGKYNVEEHGIIMGIMSIMPRSAYQQGVDRQWLQKTRYDFVAPEFVHLSEQAIMKGEIAAKENDETHNQQVFGYQGMYDEYRTKKSMVCAQMRDTLDYWHIGRKFNDVSTVELNTSFVICDPSKRIFAVQDEDGIIGNVGNIVRCIRPLPLQAEPGLIDH